MVFVVQYLPMRILAIESSCDETAASVVQSSGRYGGDILSNVISSQIEIHAVYGGVVPEVAARSHIEVILSVVERALEEAKSSWAQIDAIAVTKGPGLIGSLMVGVLTARTLAVAKNKPLIGVNHIFAHGFASFLTENKPEFPFLALTVSGGHTALSMYHEDLSREVLGETLDDAAGEAFDKVAKLLGLGYPGGPAIGQAALIGDDKKYKFPVAKLGSESLDFSFSGLKTAVLRQLQELTGTDAVASSRTAQKVNTAKSANANNNNAVITKSYQLDKQTVADISASFQAAAVTALVKNTQKAWLRYQPKSLVIGGGVACNSELRSQLLEIIPTAIFVPPILCTDNAAMIGALALQMARRGFYTKPSQLLADSSLETI